MNTRNKQTIETRYQMTQLKILLFFAYSTITFWMLLIFATVVFFFTAPLAQAAITNGENALDALGQYDESTSAPLPIYTKSTIHNGPNQFGLNFPSSMVLDSGNDRLFVSDRSNNRVLVYNLNVNDTLIDRIPDNVLGQANFYSNTGANTQVGMQSPEGLAYDATNKYLFVSQSVSGSRVTVYDVTAITNGENAINVLGQSNFTDNTLANSQTGMNQPHGLVYDSANKYLFVADTSANRVTVYDLTTITDGENAINVLGQANFTASTGAISQTGMSNPQGLAYDSTAKYLFVSDDSRSGVSVYDLNTITDGENAINVLGQADFSSFSTANTQVGMNTPMGLTYDATNKYLFVADGGNHRVVVYDLNTITDGENAINVLGQSNFTNSSAANTQVGMNTPRSLTYDGTNKYLFVTETGSSRVTVYDMNTITNGENAIDVLGQYDESTSAPLSIYTKSLANNGPNQFGFSTPSHLEIDATNNRLFVSDAANNRVLIYNLNANDTLIDRIPDNVLGQANFYSSTAANSQAGMNSPQGMAYDSARNYLFVSGSGNRRVTVYDVAAITNGENAINVLGQSTFTASGSANTQVGMNAPRSIVYDSTNKYLFVADSGNRRALVYDLNTITNGENAINVLGQANFTANSSATTQTGSSGAQGLAYDSTRKYLFVSDGANNRVVVYDLNTITDGENAINVLGQPDFVTADLSTSQVGMSATRGLVFDSTNNRLFVSDTGNNRVLVFDVGTITDGENAINVLGQANYTDSATANTQTGLNNPQGLAYDGTNKYLYVVGANNNRVTVYDAQASSISGTVYTNEGSTTMGSGRTVAVSINGAAAAGTTTTASDGTYTVSNLSVTPGDVLTIYLDGASEQAVTVTVATGVNQTAVDLYQNDLITRCDNSSCSLTNTNLDTADNNADTDISAIYSVSGGALTVASGKSLYIPSSHIFAPGGNVSVGGNFTNNGTYTKGTETLTLTGTGAQTLKTNASSLYNLTVNGSGGTYTLQDALTTTNNLTITAGTLDVSASNYAVSVGGNFSNSGTFTARSGTVTLTSTSSSATLTSDSSSFYNLIQNGSGGTYTLQDALTTSNNLTITAGTLDTKASSNFGVSVGGTWSRSGTFTVRSATLTLTGTSTFSDTMSFYNLTINGSGQTVTLGAALTTSNNLTVSTGTLDVSASNYGVSVGGTWSRSGTFTPRSGTLTLTGTSTFSDTMSFYNLTINGSTKTVTLGATLTLTGNLTITAGTLNLNGNTLTLPVSNTFSNTGTLQLQNTETLTNFTNDTDSGTVTYTGTSTYTSFKAGNTYYNVTFNASGATWSLPALLTVNGNLTITAGTLDHNGYNVTLAGNLSNSGTISNSSARTYTLNGTTQTFNPGAITISTLTLTGSSGTVTLGSNFTLTDTLTIPAGRTLALSSYTLTATSATLTNAGTINEGTGKIVHTSSGFYIADSNFDIDDAISLATEKVYVTLTDSDANLDGASADTLTVTVSCTTDSESVTLTETGNATGVFRNSGGLTTAVGASGTNNNGTLTCANNATITASYTDAQDTSDTQSDTATATTDTIPTAPSSFSGTAASSTSITWTWTDNASNETGFKLYDSSNTLITTISTANATSYTETGLTAATSYTRKIVAYNTAGNSSYSNSSSVTTNNASPTTPTSFAGSAASSTSITWTWTDASTDETSFLLQDSSGTTVATITSTTTAGTGTTISYTETGLATGTSYTRKVAAKNSSGTSASTSTASVSTSANVSPSSPTLLTPDDKAISNNNLPTFSFKKSTDSDDGVSSYTLHVGSLTFSGIPANGSSASNPLSATHYSDRYTAQYFHENDGNDSNDTITVTLKADNSSALPLLDKEYSWYVVAVDGASNATSSSTRSITIDATKPTITSLAVANANQQVNTYTTTSTKPKTSFTVEDTQGLAQVVVTLSKPNKLLFFITGYTPVESTTFTVTGTKESLVFTPKTELTPGTNYRLSLTVTDTAGNQTNKIIILSIQTPVQVAQEQVAQLNPVTSPTEKIIETLRATLPETAFNIPDLQAKALLRRQLQIQNFNTFLEKLSRMVASVLQGQGWLERALAFIFNATSQSVRVASSAVQAGTHYAQTTLITLAHFGFDVGREIILAASPYTHDFSDTARLYLPQGFVNNLTMPKPNQLFVTAVKTGFSQKISDAWRVTAKLFNRTADMAKAGRETRVKVALSNRQSIVSGLNNWALPAVKTSRRLGLATRHFYEDVFDMATPTYIANLKVATLTPTSALVEWDTNHLTRNTKINYGETTSYGEEVFSDDLSDHHRLEIPNLKPNTTYYFEVMNQNGHYVFDAYYTLTTPQEGSMTTDLIPQRATILGDQSVALYAEANPTADVITLAEPGQSYRVVLQKGNWVALLLPSGKQGWVQIDKVKLENQTGVSAESTRTTY